MDNLSLDVYEQRVIGALMEKAATTPDQYPLSLNALTNACNQKSNREPVMSMDEGRVRDVVDGLVKRGLVSEKTGFGSRVIKFQQRFCNSEFSALQFSAGETAIICILLLRGPQTPGELRSRSDRLHRFADIGEVEAALTALSSREDGPFVKRLPREAGKRESRYCHLFSDPDHQADIAPTTIGGEENAPAGDRLTMLENEVQSLRTELDALKKEFRELLE